MITLTVGDNLNRKEIQINETLKTPQSVLKAHSPNYERSTNYLAGAVLPVSDMQKTFAELGITQDTSLISVAKLENA